MTAASPQWSEPGCHEVAEGVYRIPLPLPNDALRAINVYALTDGTDLVLIDSGWALAESRKLLAEALATLGAELGDVREFLITHIHRDHYTQAVALRREFGTKVSLGVGERPSLRLVADPGLDPLQAQLDGVRLGGGAELLAGLSEELSDEEPEIWEPPDEWLTPGRRSVLPGRELEVVATPGHTDGHVVFVDGKANLLFSGDHVLPHITPSIGFQAAATELPLKDYLGSLRVVREMPDRRLLPAHGPVTESVHARVDELLTHHRERLDSILALVAAGATTAFETALRMGWTRRARKLPDLDPFNRMLAVLETGAHLDVLTAQGKLTATEIDGVRYYRCA
ncbi:MBL fold metallo-hydrolase [Amycolatopsis sp. NPDC101161]|uniref:MBL fold metallo-hydrolase n=1 Tax=Amycolatopsis sp. NPDC101161 TaxID=3363940 RepID=UPI0038229025